MHAIFMYSHCGGAGLTIADVLEDYDFGLKALACRGEVPCKDLLAPLRALQCPSLRGRWRFGQANLWAMAWKAIVYALHRSVMGRANDVEPHCPHAP